MYDVVPAEICCIEQSERWSVKPSPTFLQFPTEQLRVDGDLCINSVRAGLMTRNRSLLIVCAGALTACFNQTLPANAPVPQSGSVQSVDRVWFTGTSNIRRFTCT